MNHRRPHWESTSFPHALCTLALTFVTILALPLGAVAADAPRVVALGESNDAAERAELLAFFGAPADADVVPVTVAETLRATGNGFDLSGVDTAYSSAALACAPAGTGVAVVTRNIELVPPALYALALVTAGVTDVRLAVAAPTDNAALGMTALAGVFKAWDAAPCGTIGGDASRRQLALDEVALVARIGQARNGADGVLALTGAMQDAQLRVVAGADPEQALAAATANAGLNLAPNDLADGTAFLTRLSAAGVDWAGFAHGWTLGKGPKGEGVLLSPIGHHVVRAAGGAVVPTGVGGLAATATPALRSSATPAPTMTATATVTTTAPATGLTPITGTVQGVDGDRIAVTLQGSDHPTELAFADGAVLTRTGQTVKLADMRPGDQLTGSVRTGDGRIMALDATPPPAVGRGSIPGWRLAAAMTLGLLTLLGLLLLLGRRRHRPVFGGRVSPAVAAAAVAQRRAGEGAEGISRRVVAAAPRRISVRRRLTGGARSSRRTAAEG